MRVNALVPSCSSEQGNAFWAHTGWERWLQLHPRQGWEGHFCVLPTPILGTSCYVWVMGPCLGRNGWACTGPGDNCPPLLEAGRGGILLTLQVKALRPSKRTKDWAVSKMATQN